MKVEVALSHNRLLSPTERLSEILFGLVMVLTFTGSLSVAEAGRDDVKAMLIGALGCNLAWGLIDAIFYLMGCLAERSQALSMFRAVREAKDGDAARRVISQAIPPMVASILKPAEFEAIQKRLGELPEPPGKARLDLDDWRAALGIFLLVFLSMFPVALPFLFMHSTSSAMRVSNGIALVMLFVAGCAFGRVTGRRPWSIGIGMAIIGSALVALTIALGG